MDNWVVGGVAVVVGGVAGWLFGNKQGAERTARELEPEIRKRVRADVKRMVAEETAHRIADAKVQAGEAMLAEQTQAAIVEAQAEVKAQVEGRVAELVKAEADAIKAETAKREAEAEAEAKPATKPKPKRVAKTPAVKERPQEDAA